MKATRILDKRIRTLKKIEKQEEAAKKRHLALGNKRIKFLETLWDNPIRKTEVTKEVIELRGKALKNETVRSLLEQNHTSIKDVAIVITLGDETYIGKQWECPGFNSSDDIFGFLNDWLLRHRYIFGGPKDRVKLLFRGSENNRDYFCGIIFNDPLKHEKKAA